jgi:LysM repeat protein
VESAGNTHPQTGSGKTVAEVLAILALALVAAAVVALVFVKAGGDSGTRGNGLRAGSSDNPKDPYYVVQPGDSFTTIAAKEGVGRALIRRLNPNLDPLAIQPENCVNLVPHGCRKLAGGNSGALSPERPNDPNYVVRSGDSLSTIAANEGVGLARIIHLNPNLHPDTIQPGECVDLIPHGCRQLAAPSSGQGLAFHHLP